MMLEKLTELLKGLHPEADIENEDGLIDNGILNSFDIVTIIAEVDDMFDVKIPASEIVPENFNSVRAMSDLVERISEEF